MEFRPCFWGLPATVEVIGVLGIHPLTSIILIIFYLNHQKSIIHVGKYTIHHGCVKGIYDFNFAHDSLAEVCDGWRSFGDATGATAKYGDLFLRK